MGSPDNIRNLVLIGRTGNGKSTTGNSILGKQAFKTGRSMSSVTKTSKMVETSIIDDDDEKYDVRVVDTPGLFDGTTSIENLSKEIVRCMQLAKEGIHAFIAVLSTGRFTEEEAKSLNHLERLFGSKAVERMIVLFTGGERDDLKDASQWSTFLSTAPDHLQKFIYKCSHRVVLFDNFTTDENKKEKQRRELLNLVNKAVKANNDKPYTNDIYEKVQEEMNKPGMPKKPPNKLTENLKPVVDEMKLKLMQELVPIPGKKGQVECCSIM